MRFAPLLGATAALRAPPRLPRRLPCRASSGASVDAAAAPNKLDGVLPLAYGAASAALVAKSFKLRRAPPDAAACCALAALATVTHAPTARTQLKSVRRARETARAEVSQRGGAEKRYNARAWRRAVVLRLAAQWAGLLRTILGEDVFVGAATVLGANAGFWLTGGAHRRHDASGSFTPVPYATAFLVFVIDAAIVGCALLAARRPPGYARAFYASVVVAACGFGVLEMLPRWLRKGK